MRGAGMGTRNTQRNAATAIMGITTRSVRRSSVWRGRGVAAAPRISLTARDGGTAAKDIATPIPRTQANRDRPRIHSTGGKAALIVSRDSSGP